MRIIDISEKKTYGQFLSPERIKQQKGYEVGLPT